MQCSKGNFATALQQFDQLDQDEASSPEANYVKGNIYAGLFEPDKARAAFQAAKDTGFPGYSTWGWTSDRLNTFRELQRIQPPFIKNIDYQGRRAASIYGIQTTWSRPVIDELPRFVGRAFQIFGRATQPINFYLFDKRDRFESYYKLIFSVSPQNAWHDGTGNKSIVVFCEVSKTGMVTRPAGIPRTLGDVMHEYGHALCNTTYGDGYLRSVPHWIDEGMADFVAEPYYADLYAESDRELKSGGKTKPPPDYDQLNKDFFKDPYLNYAIARMMFKEVMRGKSPSYVVTILTDARRVGFESAIRQSGISGREALQRVKNTYWR
ncbi:MAG: tetratricopeptide repeat protein [Candidatus Obscuribacterales bacterium]|nr:tetratricopeptide repeat protein [Candidatus Obscuribacterales bacterium]